MAAPLGFKDFTTGEVLTAADVDGYLMQGIWVFASAAARDAAVTSPQEGNFAFLKDTNVTTYYTGSAWANLDTTGMVNPMTTTGDTIYSSGGSTPARLGIGSTGQVLTVAGGIPSWATPAAATSGLTLITTASPSAATSVNINNCFSSTYQNYIIYTNVSGTAGADFLIRLRASGTDATTGYIYQALQATGSTVQGSRDTSSQVWAIGATRTSGRTFNQINIGNPFATAESSYFCISQDPLSGAFIDIRSGSNSNATSYDGMTIYVGSGNFTGSIRVYGVQNS